MITLKEAFTLCRIKDDEVIWLSDGSNKNQIGCIPMTGEEVRRRYDMRNTQVTFIDMHGFEETNGFTFTIKQRSL